ncbi:MAG: SUMF1/EgtB/PvdO family nonheme iron enzyme [bacterium]
MSEASYRVFVSSTYLDNESRRKTVENAILRAGMVPVGMERFAAQTHTIVQASLDEVRSADVFVGIVARRYGSILAGEELSVCELEYGAARKATKPCLMFLIDSRHPFTEQDLDPGPERWAKQGRLDAFKARFTADQLPATFTDDTLGMCVLDALNRWRRDQEGMPSPGPVSPGSTPSVSDDPDVAGYLAKAANLHATLPIAGFRTKLRAPIEIAELYVPLHAMVDLRGVGDAVFADADDAAKRLYDTEQSLEIDLTRAFDEAARRNRRGLVILGDPGSGKTTHLKRLLLWCAREGAASLGLPVGTIPVFLPLRDLRDLTHGLELFIEGQLSEPHLATPAGFGRKLLDRGGLLLLLDGLDEVADPGQREQVARWIDTALRTHPSCRFVVTSRFAGYTQEARLSESFLELHLRPLTAEQADHFVHNWYRIVERGLAVDPAQGELIAKTRADELVARLKEPDFRARRVFELTRNPLLLTNLCLVHRDRGRLPKRRAELYDECIDVLLERWRVGKGLGVGTTAKEARRVLQPVALWLHQEVNRTRARVEQIEPVVAAPLAAIGYERGGAREFLRTVRDESGLLIGWDQEHYGFMHLGFQEYLAAREIRTRSFDDPAVLAEMAKHFGESWWQEVILLLLALDDPALFKPFMRELVQLPAFAEHPDLVELCLDDAAEVSLEPFEDLVLAPPLTDPVLWESQVAAFKILVRLAPARMAELVTLLRSHPSPEIQARLRASFGAAHQETVIAARGGYELVRIPGGVFQMGSPESEEGRWDDEGPHHQVRVSSFWLGRYPVTNEQYGAYLRENPGAKEPERWSDRRYNQPRQPVVGVSWHEARAYADWARLRLPTEAEWEYACRAGTTTRYSSGDSEADLDRVGWYDTNSGGALHPVGEKEPNAFGLFDMHGNVWEWVEDDWHGDYRGAPTDGRAWIESPRGARRVLRGGSFANSARFARAAYRLVAPGGRRGYRGFRLARSDP